MGLVSLSYLWRRDQAELFDEMIDSKVEAILIKVATLGLDGKHLGLSLSQVRDHLHKMVNIYPAQRNQRPNPNLRILNLNYRTSAIICRSRFEAALVYKPRILGLKNEEFPFLVHKLSVI